MGVKPLHSPLFSLVIGLLALAASPLPSAHAAETMPPLTIINPPAIPQYDCLVCAPRQIQGLTKLLGEYQAIAAKGGWPAWKMGKKLQEGMTDPRVPNLKQHLIITGDYKQPADNTLLYDATLAMAVKCFQFRHGLTPDGRAGHDTQLALSMPIEARITSIRATLARLQAAPALENRSILINLPAYTLYALSPDKPMLSMRIIIGNVKNHTPLFNSAITSVTFNPPWRVPPRIAQRELTPKLLEDPDYFVDNDFVVTQNGRAIDPHSANPALGYFTFRQRAGEDNALGKIKFNLPDTDGIYLHATSAPKLFSQDMRALSHGCMRLDKPRELAHFVFASAPKWDAARIDETYDDDANHTFNVPPVPVHVVYWTVFINEDGTAGFYNDIYRKDKKDAK